jgi:hypothetical protein
MNRMSLWIARLGLLCALVVPASSAFARTDVSIGLQFGDRYRGPDVYFQSEPRIVMVPGTRVYYVRDADYDIYRYGRFWYYNYNGGWYRSRSYSGPWIYVGYRTVPREISYVPYRYRRHWRDFRDNNARYGSYRDRDWRDRNRYRDDRVRDLDRYRDDRNDNRDWRDR